MLTIQQISEEIIKEYSIEEYFASESTLQNDNHKEERAEPLKSHQWRFEIDGIDNSFLMKNISGLSYTRETCEYYSYGGNTTNYMSNYMTPDTLQVQLYDTEASGANQIMEWIGDGTNFLKKDAVLYQHDRSGDVVRRWTLKGLYPIKVNFGELDYESSDPIVIDIKFIAEQYILEQ